MGSLALLRLPPFTPFMLLVILTLAIHALLRQVPEVDHHTLLMLPFPVPKKMSLKRRGESLCTPKMEYILHYGNFEASKTYHFLHSWQHVLSSETSSQFRYSKLSFWDAMNSPIPQNNPSNTSVAETEVFNLNYRTVETLLKFNLLG